MLGTETANGFFLGESHDRYVDLLLPGRPGFIYYNDALEDLPVIFDTGESVLVSPDLADFVTYNVVENGSLTIITGESQVVGSRTIKWVLHNDAGKLHTIHTKGYYVPTAKVRLFSVQSYLGVNQGSFTMEGVLLIFYFNDCNKLTFKMYNVDGRRSCLPLAYITKAIDFLKQREHRYNVISASN